ncbi:hypothetical protein [Devosia sp. A449]
MGIDAFSCGGPNCTQRVSSLITTNDSSIMALNLPAQTMMNLAPSVGHIILSYAAIDTMIVLTTEMVRPLCELDGTVLKHAYRSSDRITELERAFNSPVTAPWRDEGLEVIRGINGLKVVRDLLAHGQIDINNLGVGDVLYFAKVNPNKAKTAQEAQVLSITAADLKEQAAIALTLQARFYTLIARMIERPGGWMAPT